MTHARVDEEEEAACAAEALERYQAALGDLGEGQAPDARFRLWRALQEVRRHLVEYPALRAGWVIVLVSHHELLSALDSAPGDRFFAVLELHRGRVESMAAICRQMGSSSRPPPTQRSETAGAFSSA